MTTMTKAFDQIDIGSNWCMLYITILGEKILPDITSQLSRLDDNLRPLTKLIFDRIDVCYILQHLVKRFLPDITIFHHSWSIFHRIKTF